MVALKMKGFLDWLSEQDIDEKALNIGNKSAMPAFNQAVILAGGAGCFAPETLVKTSTGRKAIKDIVEGDVVESWNEEAGQLEWNPVLKVNTFPPVKRMMRLTFDNGEEIVCSEDHEFLVDEKWIQAKDLSTKKEYIDNWNETVYDLVVEKAHSYVVGTNSDIIVHNSGKGMVLNNILNIPNAKVFDVDKLKTDILTMKPKSMATAFLKQTGRELGSIDLGKPEDVALMHQFVSDNRYDKKVISNFFTSTGDIWPDGTPKPEKNKNKPNVVFDVTLKDEKKMFNLCDQLQRYGWDAKDIHLAWILNDFEVASIQNQSRERKVPKAIFDKTHVGASNTMKEIVTNFRKFSKCMDGEIWIIPNQRNIDNVFEFTGKNKDGQPILKLKFYNAMKVKERGKPVPDADEVLQKHFTKEGKQGESLASLIDRYVPKDADKWK